jgi:hypothetical protein
MVSQGKPMAGVVMSLDRRSGYLPLRVRMH